MEFRQFRFANNARSTLLAGLTASATSLRVQAGEGSLFPAVVLADNAIFSLILWNQSLTQYEVVYCPSRSGDILTIERAKEGTTALDFAAGASVVHNVTAGFFDRLTVDPPALNLLSLETVEAGSAQQVVVVTGVGFFAGAVVNVNGSPRVTRFTSSTEVEFDLLDTDQDTPGTLVITVTNPGGLVSNALSLEVVEAPVGLNISNQSAASNPSVVQLRYIVNGDENGGQVRGGGIEMHVLPSITDVDDEYLPGWQDGDFPIGIGADYEIRWTLLSGSISFSPLAADATPFPQNTWSFSEWSKALAIYDVGGWSFGGDNPVWGQNSAGVGQVVFQVQIRKIDLTDGPVSATITLGDLPPVIDSLSPSTLEEDNGAFTLTITGQNFQANSVARWEGADRTTVFNSSTELEASILAGDVDDVGTFDVTVYNPNSEQASAAEPFDVTAPALLALSNHTVTAASGNAGIRLNADTNGGNTRGGGLETVEGATVTDITDEFLFDWESGVYPITEGSLYELRWSTISGTLDFVPSDGGFNPLPENTWSFSEWASALAIYDGGGGWHGGLLTSPVFFQFDGSGAVTIQIEIRRIDLQDGPVSCQITLDA